MVAKIEIISKELIKPSSPTPLDTKHLKLSFVDQLVSPIYVPLIFFYQNHETSFSTADHVKRPQLLKQSLSEALAIFYPLAGRINGNLFVDCNDSGALFVEARVHSHLTLQEIPIEELNQYLPFEQYAIADNIPLAIQFSSFECGGTAVGVCISHKMADAMSLVTFMNTWAAINMGKAEEIVHPDFHLASQLFPPLDQEFALPGSKWSAKNEKFVTKRFVFDKEKLEALKEEAASSAASGSGVINDPTRVEAVSAFIWKHVIGISKAKGDGSRIKFGAVHAVNLRPRMSCLPLERFAFGNLSIVSAAFLMSKEDDQEYHNLVWHLRTAIKQINEDRIKNVQWRLRYLCYLNEGKELLSKQELGCCFFSSWCRFPIYEVDYGWGKPISVCTSAMAPWETEVMLMATRCGEGIEAWISMLENEMAMLPDELLSLATADICPSNGV